MNVVLFDQYDKGGKPMYIFAIVNATAAEKAAIDEYRNANGIKLNNTPSGIPSIPSGQPLIWVRKQYPNGSTVTVSEKGIFVDNSIMKNLTAAIENAPSAEVRDRLANRTADWMFDNIINVSKANSGVQVTAPAVAEVTKVADVEQIALGQE